MKILVVGAHPDDIEPQMGGTIANFTNKGYETLIVQFTDTGGKIKDIRNQESFNAAKILGSNIKYLNYDQKNFIFKRELIQKLDKIILDYKPDEVFTCWEHDSHQDHQVVSKVVLAATRNNNANVYFFEPIIPGGTTPHCFKINYYVDISDTIEKKIESIKAYQSQIKKFGPNWIPAISGRARLRGFQINVKYAEAFQVVKKINRNLNR